MNNISEVLVTIATAIVGLAILSVLVSSKSNTTGVIQAAGSAFSNALGVATSPVTGATVNVDTSYPTSSMGAYGGLTLNNFGSF